MKELKELEFTIDEYLKDPSTVLSRAMAIVKSQSLSQRDVQLYLEGRCRQMMMDSISWDPLVWPIIDSGFMSCMVDGHKIEFFVKVEPRHMSVTLLRDGIKSRKDIELNPVSSVIFTSSPYESSEISEYGLLEAKSLAVHLYYEKY